MKSPAQRFVDYMGMGVAVSQTEVRVKVGLGDCEEFYDFSSPGCRGSMILAAFDRIASQQEQLPIEITRSLADFVESTIKLVETLAVNASKRSASGS